MTDYTQGGTTDNGSTIYGNGSATNTDPTTWLSSNDWKSIMAAICGFSAGTDDPSISATVSNPAAIQDAANVLYEAQQTLEGVAQSLTSLINELTGNSGSWYGSWQGDAASAAQDSVTGFAKQIQLNAEKLANGANGQSIPQQLANNAVNLANAIEEVNEIDSFYANEAVQEGAGTSGGMVMIHEKPQLVAMMTQDMYKVLQSLISVYQPTISNIPQSMPGVSQPTVNNSSLNPNVGNLNGINNGLGNLGDLGNLGNGLGSLGNSLGNLGANLGSGLNGLGNSLGGGLGNLGGSLGGLGNSLGSGLGGLGSGLGGTNGLNDAVTPYGGSTSVGSGTGDGLGDGSGLGTGNTGLGTGDTGLGDLSPTGFGGNTNTGGTGTLPNSSGLNSENPSTWGDNTPTSFPGDTGVNQGLGNLTGSGLTGLGNLGTGAGGNTAMPYTGNTSTESGLPNSLTGGTGSGLPNSLESPGTGSTSPSGTGSTEGGMPYMPMSGMGGMGAGGMGGAGDTRSDASGLLNSDAAPWEGKTNVGGLGEVGSGEGTAAGGTGLDLPTESVSPTSEGGVGSAEGGMPYMPGMGGMGAGGMGGAGDTRSDASGLLSSDAAPWEGKTSLGDNNEVGAEDGTAAGGAGLDLPSETVDPSTLEESAGEGMPYMPMGGMGAAAAAGAGAGDNRSDASGLLGSESEPWDGRATESEVGSEIGAPVGGPGLESPGYATSASAVDSGMTVDSNGMPVAAEAAMLGAVIPPAPVNVPPGQPRDQRSSGGPSDWGPPAVGGQSSPPAPAAQEGVVRPQQAAPPTPPPAPPQGPPPAAPGTPPVASQSPPPVAPQTPPAAPQTRVSMPRHQEGAQDVSAWDVAGGAFAPLLWSLSRKDGGESRSAESAAPADQAAVSEADSENPSLTTWRPDRSAPIAGPVRVNAGAFRCSTAPPSQDEKQPEETDEVEEVEEVEEEQSKGIADLLVQDQSTWGSWPHRESSEVF